MFVSKRLELLDSNAIAILTHCGSMANIISCRQQPVACWVNRLAQWVWRLATGWTVRGLNPGEGEIYRTRPNRSWGPPSLLHKWYRVFPGGKAAEVWRWQPTPSSAEVEGRVQPYICSALGLRGPVLGWTLPLRTHSWICGVKGVKMR